STTAASSCSSDCAKAFPKKHRDAINTNLLEFRTGRAVEPVIKNRIVTPVRLAASVRRRFAHRAESCPGVFFPGFECRPWSAIESLPKCWSLHEAAYFDSSVHAHVRKSLRSIGP